jgi:hypothetical protein
MPTYHQGDKKIHIESWGSHVDQIIREAQARGDFDNLPGMGQPLQLEGDNPFNPEWSAAFRVAKNAGAAPLWVQLDKEIGANTEALATMLDRTARYLECTAARIALSSVAAGPVAPHTSRTREPAAVTHRDATQPRRAAPSGRKWWPFRRAAAPQSPPDKRPTGPQTLNQLEAERLRARALYMSKAAEIDEKIVEFNSYRPRTLSWLEKPRLLPAQAAQRFDERCPPISSQ